MAFAVVARDSCNQNAINRLAWTMDEAMQIYMSRTADSYNTGERQQQFASIAAFPLHYSGSDAYAQASETHIAYVIYSSSPIKDHTYYFVSLGGLDSGDSRFMLSAPQLDEPNSDESNELINYLGRLSDWSLAPADGQYLTFRTPTSITGPSYQLATLAALMGVFPEVTLFTGEVICRPLDSDGKPCRKTGRNKREDHLDCNRGCKKRRSLYISGIGSFPHKVEFAVYHSLLFVVPTYNVEAYPRQLPRSIVAVSTLRELYNFARLQQMQYAELGRQEHDPNINCSPIGPYPLRIGPQQSLRVAEPTPRGAPRAVPPANIAVRW